MKTSSYPLPLRTILWLLTTCRRKDTLWLFSYLSSRYYTHWGPPIHLCPNTRNLPSCLIPGTCHKLFHYLECLILALFSKTRLIISLLLEAFPDTHSLYSNRVNHHQVMALTTQDYSWKVLVLSFTHLCIPGNKLLLETLKYMVIESLGLTRLFPEG